MPAEQTGSIYKTASGYGVRWYDENHKRCRRAGFKSRTEARRWFQDVERKRMRGDRITPAPITLTELVDEYLGQHVAEPSTLRSLRERLKIAVEGIPVEPWSSEREHGFGHVRVDRLDARTVGAWRRRLPEGSGWQTHKALRQALAYAVRAKLIDENVAALVPNPAPKRREVSVFGDWGELERIAVELPVERQSLPILVAGTGLRPEEWLALERRDIDLRAGVLHVRRVYTDGRVRDYGKQGRSLRRIPLRQRVLDALERHPWRIDTPLIYPADRGGYLDLKAWRRAEWYPSLESAGLDRRVPYALRHTFASFAIAAGVSLFYLARLMGSSVDQIDRTYGHLLPDSEAYLRGLLDAYDSHAVVAEGEAL